MFKLQFFHFFQKSSDYIVPAQLMALKVYFLAFTFVIFILDSNALKNKILYEAENVDGKFLSQVGYNADKTKFFMAFKIAIFAGLDICFRYRPIESLINKYKRHSKSVDVETGEIENLETKDEDIANHENKNLEIDTEVSEENKPETLKIETTNRE